MGRRSWKKPFFSFSKKGRSGKRMEMQLIPAPAEHHLVAKSHCSSAAVADAPVSAASAVAQPHGGKVAKKKTGARLWMRFDRAGQSEVLELEKSAIIKRAAIPLRDLRILGPVFSHSSNILAREKAMVVNLEFIKAIVTAEEVLILDPLCQEVLPFIDQLRQQLPIKSPFEVHDLSHDAHKSATAEEWTKSNEAAENEHELPFEFQVLEIALEVVCSYLDCSVTDLEKRGEERGVTSRPIHAMSSSFGNFGIDGGDISASAARGIWHHPPLRRRLPLVRPSPPIPALRCLIHFLPLRGCVPLL